ncbi:MAG: hypothetical protein ACI9LX_003782 [Paraglaciecola sp.]|jgi:hypothetical protein
MIYIKVADLDASITQVVKLSVGILIIIKTWGQPSSRCHKSLSRRGMRH